MSYSHVRIVLWVGFALSLGCSGGAEGEGSPAGRVGSGSAGAPAGRAVGFLRYLGDTGYDQARDVAVDSSGNVYVVGGTYNYGSTNRFGAARFVVGSGAAELGVHDFDAVVTKLDPNGSEVWSTMIGGPNYERAYAVEVDGEGNVYVAGRAGPGMPVTAGAFQTRHMGGRIRLGHHYGSQDGFIMKLDRDGALLWASFIGDSSERIVRDMDIDADGDIYLGLGTSDGTTGVSGQTKPRGWETWFPSSDPRFNAPSGGQDAILAKVSSDGSRVLWAHHIGGSRDDSQKAFSPGRADASAPSVRVDGSRGVVITFGTESDDLPVADTANKSVYQARRAGKIDLYVAKFSLTGDFLYGTYVGSGGNDNPLGIHALEVDAQGRVYIAGYTDGAESFPAANPLGITPASHFVLRLAKEFTRIEASLFVHHVDEGIGIDGHGNVYITGTTSKLDLPTTPDAVQMNRNPQSASDTQATDGLIIGVRADFSGYNYLTYVGGNQAQNGNDRFRGIAVAPSGAMYVVGTGAAGWPTTVGPAFAGNGDITVLKLEAAAPGGH